MNKFISLLKRILFGPKIESWSQGPISKAGDGGLVTAAIIGGIASLGAAGISANAAKKAAASGNRPIDIDALDARARQIAQQNAYESAALEKALTPEVSQLRTDSINQVLQQMNPSGADEFTQNAIFGLAGSQVGQAQTPLLRAAIEKARSDLGLGGRLGQETQNAVTRAALSKAGTIAPGGLRMGRDITARDLGITSLDLERQRLASASQLGGQELALEAQNANTAFNNRANIINALQLLQGNQAAQFSRAMGAAQLGQSIQRPVVGLDPSSVVDLTVGNANMASQAAANRANIYGAQSQNLMNLAGNLGGYALLAYNNRTPSAAPAGGDGTGGGFMKTYNPTTGRWIQ